MAFLFSVVNGMKDEMIDYNHSHTALLYFTAFCSLTGNIHCSLCLGQGITILIANITSEAENQYFGFGNVLNIYVCYQIFPLVLVLQEVIL